jgi:hypothetical protein
VLLGALSAATALLAGACASPRPGPLGGPGDPSNVCVPAREGHTITMGIYALENGGKIPATIQSVHLTHPHGLSMTKAWVIPIVHTTGQYDLVGEQLNYPPRWSTWAHRQPVPGAVVPAGKSLNLVFGVTRTTAKTGTSGYPVVTYTAGGNTYTLTETISLVVTAKRNC